jgi:hypothetical protein
MRRATLLALIAVGGCKLTNDAALAEHVAVARKDVARLRATAEAFVRDKGRCPTAGEVERVVDPWGHPYVVVCPGQKGHAADVVSRGADGDVGTSDDVRSWE